MEGQAQINANAATSEVGYALPTNTTDAYLTALQVQNYNLMEIIKNMQTPKASATDEKGKLITLPKFHPEGAGADASAWCTTVDLIFADKIPEGSSLMITLSKALEGSASQWLSQICFAGITWPQFKELFVQRFVGIETSAATLMKILNGRPKSGESHTEYGSRIVTLLMSKFKSIDLEEIAVSLTLAHMAQIDDKLSRWVFTNNIKTRNDMQQQLQAHTFQKRNFDDDASTTGPERKKFKYHSQVKCNYCGKTGHKYAECRARQKSQNQGKSGNGSSTQGSKDRKTKCLPIIPRGFRWAVINHVHESIMHLGWEKTLDKVFCYYWFENMPKYVRRFVENCITCKVSKPLAGKVQAELHPIPKIEIPWHTIHIDITGKLSGKNDFTKFVYFHHTLNIDSDSCIKAVKSAVSLFGLPTRIIADQGRSFASKSFRDFCSSQKINLHLIATGASRANGQVERVMSTLKGMLTAVESSQRSWQDALAEVQLAMNCTINRVTKCSPLELLIGKEARPFGLLPLNEDNDDEVDRENLRKEAKKNMKTQAEYDKNRFDKNKAKIVHFKVGDHVLLKNEERHQVKLDPKFKGPFKIIEVLDGDRYTLKSLTCKRTYKYSHECLRAIPNNQIHDELCKDRDSSIGVVSVAQIEELKTAP
ncbi:uncharacterized protein LOC116803251 [Drosophila sechellia]|uniref:uncharacterized protein LOC116803251 n=1 Tax=Drosophila sechellia TaxID=7238 RepID=UPI0013DE77F9|nr:uncharacterized protein LOC116803251 [Drosophila sechellia]